MRDDLRLVYQARFGALPPEVRTAIGTPEQIAALVRVLRERRVVSKPSAGQSLQ